MKLPSMNNQAWYEAKWSTCVGQISEERTRTAVCNGLPRSMQDNLDQKDDDYRMVSIETFFLIIYIVWKRKISKRELRSRGLRTPLRRRATSRLPKRWNLERFLRGTDARVVLLLAIPTINHRRVPQGLGNTMDDRYPTRTNLNGPETCVMHFPQLNQCINVRLTLT